jgi:hypothetical protein
MLLSFRDRTPSALTAGPSRLLKSEYIFLKLTTVMTFHFMERLTVIIILV